MDIRRIAGISEMPAYTEAVNIDVGQIDAILEIG